jgi:phosphoenolpyruvate-protein kinase (PTS system EI component)
VREVLAGVRAALETQGHEPSGAVPLGVMVEVPSVLFCLEPIIREADFVSVGTNDLVQYLLAVDRDNPWVARLYQPYHPAVMRALEGISRAANAAGKPCSVCGDVAGDPTTALLLLGMGYDAVSVAPNFFPEIKEAVRRTHSSAARELAAEVLRQTTIADVLRVMQSFRGRLRKT